MFFYEMYLKAKVLWTMVEHTRVYDKVCRLFRKSSIYTRMLGSAVAR